MKTSTLLCNISNVCLYVGFWNIDWCSKWHPGVSTFSKSKKCYEFPLGNTLVWFNVRVVHRGEDNEILEAVSYFSTRSSWKLQYLSFIVSWKHTEMNGPWYKKYIQQMRWNIGSWGYVANKLKWYRYFQFLEYVQCHVYQYSLSDLIEKLPVPHRLHQNCKHPFIWSHLVSICAGAKIRNVSVLG